MSNHFGQTMFFDNVYIKCGYTLAGPKEQAGRLHDRFDETVEDDKCGECSFEKAERIIFSRALMGLTRKSGRSIEEVDTVIGGDLLNQIISASFACRELPCSFAGIYNACATFAESLIIGSLMIDNYYKSRVICLAGSHFSTAERQYRYPLELGVLRSPVSQWTVTGAGATLLENERPAIGRKIKIKAATLGRVVDFGISDVNNMGAAMAPAAVNTLLQYFSDTGAGPEDFDVIATGDLGYLGSDILRDLMKKHALPLSEEYMDCGGSLYYRSQQTYQGGSGAAASAVVFNSSLLDRLRKGSIKRMLLIGTGALMSPLTSFQGETIPVIAHLTEITSED